MTHLEAKKLVESFVAEQEHNKLKEGSLIEALCLFYKWLSLDLCIIRDVHADLIPLKPNRAQLIVLAKMMQQARKGYPVRLVILKARKVGISTLIQALFFFLCSHFNRRIAVTIGHEATATAKIFDITKLIGEQYPIAPSESHLKEIRFSATKSGYYCATAGGSGVGAGDTPNYLHLTEIPKWPKRGVKTDYTATYSIPDSNPDTIIIYESTAQGRELFYQKFEDAHKPENPYEPIFIAWYMDDRNVAPIQEGQTFSRDDEENRIYNDAQLNDIEVSSEAFNWRRQKIATTTGGRQVFRQEYPSTPEEAVQASEGLVLPGMGNYVVDHLPFLETKMPEECRVGGIDYGFYDATVIINAYMHDRILWIADIYHAVEKLARDHAGALRRRFTYWIDPSASMGREELLGEMAKLDPTRTYCKIISAPRKKSKGESYSVAEFRLVRDMLDRGRIRIVRSCAERLLIETDNLAWNERTGEPDDTRTIATGHYDTISALRYLVMGIYSRERKQTPGLQRRVGRVRSISRKASLRRV